MWIAACAAFSLLALQGCFTGIESTPQISEGDLHRERVSERPEDRYLADIAPQPPSQWERGKTWTVTDPRSERIFGTDLAGLTIAFESFEPATSIVGRTETIVRFASPKGPVAYRTDIAPDSLARMTVLDIPYAVETTTVEAVRSRMAGQTYYVNTSLWNNMSGSSIRGLRFIPVEVVCVEAGEGIYPLRLTLAYTPVAGIAATPGATKAGDTARRYFTLPMASPGGTGGGTTRDFADLFLLSDPRKRYPRISDTVWNNIIAGRVADGMTRDECRLAVGTPAEIDRQAGYSSIREIWTYPDGIRLVFIDGILTTALR